MRQNRAVLLTPDDVNLRWLLGLRWAAYLGLSLAVAVASSILRLELPLDLMAGAVAFGAITNLGWSTKRVRRAVGVRRSVAALLVLDLLAITCVLHAAGGPTNPFVLTYLLLLVIASVTLGRQSTLALFALTVLCLGALSVHPRPLRADHEHSLVNPDVETHDGHAGAAHDPARAQHLAQHLHGDPLQNGLIKCYRLTWCQILIIWVKIRLFKQKNASLVPTWQIRLPPVASGSR